MTYLTEIQIPHIEKNNRIYPCNVLASLNINQLFMRDVTIFYGSNGAGKSTLLRLIAECIPCEKKPKADPVLIYDQEHGKTISIFDETSKQIRLHYDDTNESVYPVVSKLITSSDIFETVDRTIAQNCKIAHQMQEREEKLKAQLWPDDKASQQLKKQVIGDKLAQAFSWKTETIRSNGQVSLDYLDSIIENDGLYLIDEPENCLSPLFQKELANIIIQASQYCGCQFIISTHSPFFLSIPNAKIYNLDNRPVSYTQKWYELENMQPYFELFQTILQKV